MKNFVHYVPVPKTDLLLAVFSIWEHCQCAISFTHGAKATAKLIVKKIQQVQKTHFENWGFQNENK